MLILIGLGLDTKDISVRGLDAAKRADKVMLETYTAVLPERYLEYLKEQFGDRLTQVGRSALEEDAKKTVALAKGEVVAILVPGDPLIATTHHTLIDEARKQGVEVLLSHSASIFSAAIGESGLDIYKFGPTTTIPFWSEHYKPVSFLDVIEKNLANGQHTMVLLDVDSKNNKPMPVAEALRLLREAVKARKSQLSDATKIVAMGNVGRADGIGLYADIGAIEKQSKMFEGKLVVLVVPAKLSFAEEAALSKPLSR